MIPDIEDVHIPGIDFDSISPAHGDDGIGVCDSCGTEYRVSDLYYLDDESGDRYCPDCYADWENPSDLDEYDTEEDAEETTVSTADTAEDYKNYTEDSLVDYTISWSRPPYSRERINKSKVPFKKAVSEILNTINSLDDSAKADYGITVSCEFIVSGRSYGAEAFYARRWPSDMYDETILRFNARSTSPTPDFVKDAGTKIANAFGAAKLAIET